MKNKRHNWPEVLKHFDKSKLSVPKYAKKYKVAESSLYAKLKERSEASTQTPKLVTASEGVHEITLQSSTPVEIESPPIMFQIKTATLDLNFYNLPHPTWLAEVLKVCK